MNKMVNKIQTDLSKHDLNYIIDDICLQLYNRAGEAEDRLKEVLKKTILPRSENSDQVKKEFRPTPNQAAGIVNQIFFNDEDLGLDREGVRKLIVSKLNDSNYLIHKQ